MQERRSHMDNFKRLTEEQVATFLDGNYSINELDMLNILVNDSDLLDTLDIISEMDDMVDNINEVDDFSELNM